MSRNCLNRTIYKVVLTGGPCGGKTTGQDRLATFFENMGWKVFRVPEAATILLKGGVRFAELNEKQVFDFQEDLLLAMMQIENVYFHLAESCGRDCLIICDRGTMDGSAYINEADWNEILRRNNLNQVDMRDNRYNQIIHLVTAAIGAEDFYTKTNNVARSETVEEAKAKDLRTREIWIGHPYVDLVDNFGCRNFEDKILKLIQVVCDRAGVDYGDRLAPNSKKRKFLVRRIRSDIAFPPYQDFDVLHDYLYSEEVDTQSRIRKRGQKGVWHYSHTVRRSFNGQQVETRMQISKREYEALRAHKDARRIGSYKKRWCFMYGERHFQLDIYQPPLPPKSPQGDSLMILETYTTFKGPMPGGDEEFFPACLEVVKEVTGVKDYSMFNLCLRDDATPGAIGTKKPIIHHHDPLHEQVKFIFDLPDAFEPMDQGSVSPNAANRGLPGGSPTTLGPHSGPNFGSKGTPKFLLGSRSSTSISSDLGDLVSESNQIGPSNSDTTNGPSISHATKEAELANSEGNSDVRENHLSSESGRSRCKKPRIHIHIPDSENNHSINKDPSLS